MKSGLSGSARSTLSLSPDGYDVVSTEKAVERCRHRPNAAAVIRLVAAILIEREDEWAVAERRYFSAESMQLATAPLLSTTTERVPLLRFHISSTR